MPVALRISLAPDAGRELRMPGPQQVHGAVAGIFDTEDIHHDQEKGWSVQPPAIRDGLLNLRCSWLDGEAGDFTRLEGRTLRLGPAFHPVVTVEVLRLSRRELASETFTEAAFQFESPTWFSRSGRRSPLPDPLLVYRSLERRWNAKALEADELPEEIFEEVLRGLMISEFDGRTAPMRIGDRTRVGFIGEAVFRIPHRSSEEAQRAFAALSRFAEFSGVGAETTFGAGAVSLV